MVGGVVRPALLIFSRTKRKVLVWYEPRLSHIAAIDTSAAIDGKNPAIRDRVGASIQEDAY